mmetsp:Transcript_36750/g.80248  ORF Transcript_36750/g.80248 Transcript_36750/m.80248 type:complete len:231 (-) Transcript_36750:824-1516(-)
MHHRDGAKVLLLCLDPACRHLIGSALRTGLGHLQAGVAIALGVKYENVDVLAGSQNVVQASEANVVGPTIAADDPMGGSDEHVTATLHVQELLGRLGLRSLLIDHADDVLLHCAALVGVMDNFDPFLQGCHELFGDCCRLVNCKIDELANIGDELLVALQRAQGHAQAVLCSVLEEGAGPGGALAMPVLLKGAETVGATPDRGAAAAVSDDHAIAKHLRQQLHVGCLATA